MVPHLWMLDITITPNAKFPGYSWLQSFAGSIGGLLLVVCAIAFILAAILFGIGYATGNEKLKQGALVGIVSVLIAAILIGSVSGFINWSSKQNVTKNKEVVSSSVEHHVDPLALEL